MFTEKESSSQCSVQEDCLASVQPYSDPDIAGLQLEVLALHAELADLQTLKFEIETDLRSFSLRYHQELGVLVLRILELKEDRLRREAQSDPSKRQEFEKAHTNHEEFRSDQTLAAGEPAPPHLTKDEEEELRTAFRTASKLCHPDVVAEYHRDRARQIFVELTAAYQDHDLNRVKRILRDLQHGDIALMSATSISDKERLLGKVSELRRDIVSVREEIDKMRSTVSWRTLASSADLDLYFQIKRADLEKELSTLSESAQK